MIKKIFAELEKLDDSVVSRIPAFCSHSSYCVGCRMLEVKNNLGLQCSMIQEYILGEKSMNFTLAEGTNEVIKKYFERKKYWRV